MDLEFDSVVARGLWRYVDLVTEALGLAGGGSLVQLGPPVNAYLALDGRMSLFPTRDVALLWDEEHGWSAGVEAETELAVHSYLGGDVLPAPAEVAAFATGVLTATDAGGADPVALRAADAADDLADRLARFAVPYASEDRQPA